MTTSKEERFKLQHFAIFFCFVITLHNIEEALWLPSWSQSAYAIQPVSADEFYFAIIVITALAYATAFFFVQFPYNRIAKNAFNGFLGSMIVNTVFPHLLLTIIMQSYAPGLITGLMLIIPIYTFILYALIKNDVVKLSEMIVSTIIVGVFLLILIPVLFKVSHLFIGQLSPFPMLSYIS